MRISAILIALFVLVPIAISGCLSSSKPPADLQEPRENSEGGLTMTVTYLPDITDATAFEIKVTTHSNYTDDFENSSYLQDSSGKTYNRFHTKAAPGTMPLVFLNSKKSKARVSNSYSKTLAA